MMTYTNHTEDECDKCLKKVNKANLAPYPFLYLDKNDKVHRDMSPILLQQKREEMLNASGGDLLLTELYMKKVHIEPGYRQYFICKSCWMKEHIGPWPLK